MQLTLITFISLVTSQKDSGLVPSLLGPCGAVQGLLGHKNCTPLNGGDIYTEDGGNGNVVTTLPYDGNGSGDSQRDFNSKQWYGNKGYNSKRY